MDQKQSKELLMLNKFLDDLANNTPNAKQFKKKDLGKIKRSNRKSRNLQTLQGRNTKYR
jgi:hypothetical protein